jgi:transposase
VADRFIGELYQPWRRRLDVVLRQDHAAGEKLFVDYAGATIPIHDPQRGPERQAAIFVAVLGAGNYTYAEATDSQGLENWLGSHIRTFEFMGGVPKTLRATCSKAIYTVIERPAHTGGPAVQGNFPCSIR